MNLDDVMKELASLGNERTREIHLKLGGPEPMFGVKMGDLRILAKRIKLNPELARQIWATGNLDAMFLSILLMKPKSLSNEEVESLVSTLTCDYLADWLNSYVVKLHPQKEEFRAQWLTDNRPFFARAAWSLTAEKITKDADDPDLTKIMDRIETEMPSAHPSVQWTMNFALAAIGINHEKHRDRAIMIGEKIGLYRNYPVSKGCTSPFAPIWINEMVSRNAKK